MTSKAALLGKNLGGYWTYFAPCYWHCSDGIRTVVRCSAGVDEYDEPLGPPQYWLYGEGQARRAEQYIQKKPTILPFRSTP